MYDPCQLNLLLNWTVNHHSTAENQFKKANLSI
ncbi:unnamed protein product [Blumeria hordei]|uniref:Uncharacterized protein n=1 Tax=Blumeria hordei TaxID=2867405 RepID=A0A383UN05_BLUHO|nr:unnamed protein product [Blumeria hordei]